MWDFFSFFLRLFFSSLFVLVLLPISLLSSHFITRSLFFLLTWSLAYEWVFWIFGFCLPSPHSHLNPLYSFGNINVRYIRLITHFVFIKYGVSLYLLFIHWWLLMWKNRFQNTIDTNQQNLLLFLSFLFYVFALCLCEEETPNDWDFIIQRKHWN